MYIDQFWCGVITTVVIEWIGVAFTVAFSTVMEKKKANKHRH